MYNLRLAESVWASERSMLHDRVSELKVRCAPPTAATNPVSRLKYEGKPHGFCGETCDGYCACVLLG